MTTPPTHHFNDQDVLYLIRQAPVISLSRLGSATSFLRHCVEVGEDMRGLLALYPREKMEELEFFYTCLVSLGALDARLMSDLCTRFAWRGVVWGSWLALLQPDASLLPPLGAIEAELPHNRWVVDLALDVIEGRPPRDEHRELAALAQEVRALLKDLPRPETPLRPAPTSEQLARMEEERQRVRRLYKAKGADAALELIKETSAQRHLMSHERWRAAMDAAPDE